MSLKFVIPGLCLLFLFSPALRADELADLKARNAQLEATVEELTLQLAEALRERRRLEAELAGARSSVAPSVAAPAPAAPVAESAPDATGAPVARQAPAASPAEAAADPAPEPRLREVDIAGVAPAAKEPVAVARAGIVGCDVSEALAGYDGKRAGNERLLDWLKASNNLERCTTEQLRELRGAVKWDWLGYQKEPLRLLDEEIARR
jgi:hypothetical protein